MEDLISREAAINALIDAENHAFNSFYKGLKKAHKIIANMPSAQPEEASVILGASKDGVRLWYKCSVCGEPVNADDNYCCNCGRKFINGRFDR